MMSNKIVSHCNKWQIKFFTDTSSDSSYVFDLCTYQSIANECETSKQGGEGINRNA